MAKISYVNKKGKKETTELSEEEYKGGYFHYHFDNSWWSSIQSSVESVANEELKKFIKSSAQVPETNIGFKTPSGKELSWLNLKAEDLREISKNLGQTFNQSVRDNLIQGQNRISNNLSIFSSRNNNTLQKTKDITELLDGIEQTLQYINAFSNAADAVTWNIFRRELTKNLLISNSKKKQTRDKIDENSINIISQKNLAIVNSALSTVMKRLQNLPSNIVKGEGVYSKDSLNSFMNGIIAEEIGEVGIGQWTVEKINEQTDKAMSATFQHVGKEINDQGKMQKADVIIPLIKSQPFNLSLQRTEDKASGLKLILKGDIGLSVKEYISEEKTSNNSKGFFVGIHGGGSYMRELKTMFQGLSYTALGNTLIFSNKNTDPTFRLLRSAFLARKLEEALIGKGKGKADILVVNGKYYFTSVLYRAAIANIIHISQNINQSQSVKGNGIRINFENPHHRSEEDWEGNKDKKVKNRQQALIRNSKDRAKLYKLVYTIKADPKTLIEKWLK